MQRAAPPARRAVRATPTGSGRISGGQHCLMSAQPTPPQLVWTYGVSRPVAAPLKGNGPTNQPQLARAPLPGPLAVRAGVVRRRAPRHDGARRRSPTWSAATALRSLQAAFEPMLLAVSSPGLALALAFGALVLGAWSFHHLALHWLAWRPGSIQVSEFTAGAQLSDANAEQLTMLFRRRLATLQVQSPTPVPGPPPASDFLDVLDRGGADSAQPARHARRAAARGPADARLRGPRRVARARRARPRVGVAIEVHPGAVRGRRTRRPSGARRGNARCAAPPTRRPRRSCPRRALAALRGACGAVTSCPAGSCTRTKRVRGSSRSAATTRRSTQYYEALKHDPLNMVLRLRVGQLQERLGLFLDALATY